MSAFLDIKNLSDNELIEKITDFKTKLSIVKRFSEDEMSAISIENMIEALVEEQAFRAGNTAETDKLDRGTVFESGGYNKENENG